MTTALGTAQEVVLGAPRSDSFTAFGRRVETWVADIGAVPGPDGLRAAELTSRAEAERAVHIGAPGGRVRYTAGRALARWVLASRLGCSPAEVPLVIGRNGRPELWVPDGQLWRYEQNPAGLDFNLSHAGDQVAVAVARGLRVGIDIERVTGRRNATELAERVFSKAERGLLARTAPAGYLARWYRIWTTREAYIKAYGIGLSGIADELPGPGTDWLAHEVRSAAPGYVATAVACRDNSRTGSRGESAGETGESSGATGTATQS
ncbi:4'-phosphopantetheinyl transferase family protein [Streptomyces sp. NBC_01022]|uniref:4'-phosphopantetheinyl transferase family protein n=1 Tax=Streptomyces sp. NBC_01022 TaxID=2903723 RepID=UPI002DDB1E27|nr:4'-phosphopantetheinyl transferase superfamily protein [Streptomyces sp. NBC_01022]WRZ84565.1 4'-phosphopantetheinyl transferase superfamily protein [Streptomyces sp. NBC_01022]